MTRAAFDPTAIRAVAFDGYGTLFRFHDDEFRAGVTEILTAQGLEHPDHDAVYRTFFRCYLKSGPWGPHTAEDGRGDQELMLNGPLPAWLSTWSIWRRQWELTFEELGLNGDPVHGADHLREGLSAADAYPDALDTVDQLAARGFTLGLLSNADEDFLQSALSRARLRFSVIQSSESLRAYKPNRVVFLGLCQRLGFEPHEVLYVGDSMPTDVRGATNAGLRAAWIRRSERAMPEDLPRPDLQLTALADLLELLPAR